MKKKIRITFNAPLVLGFALLCTAVTIIRLTAGDGTDRFFATYASSWSDPMTYVRLFTHVIGHAGFAHLLGNMSYILLLGPMLEEKYGWKNLLAVMLVTAAVTGLVHNLFFPRIYLLGASGIVFAFILLTSFTSVKEGEIPLTCGDLPGPAGLGRDHGEGRHLQPVPHHRRPGRRRGRLGAEFQGK